MDLALAQICGSYPKTKPLISRLFFRILCPTLTLTTRPTSLPWLGPTLASTAGSTGDTLKLMIDMTMKTLSQGWATKPCPGCGKTGSICWQLAGWFNNLLKFSGILKLVERHKKYSIPDTLTPQTWDTRPATPSTAQTGAWCSGQQKKAEKNCAKKAEKNCEKNMKKKLCYRSAQSEDSGQYQCQVSTTPIITHDIWLSVRGEIMRVVMMMIRW